jgi:hypothetical protein
MMKKTRTGNVTGNDTGNGSNAVEPDRAANLKNRRERL